MGYFECLGSIIIGVERVYVVLVVDIVINGDGCSRGFG